MFDQCGSGGIQDVALEMRQWELLNPKHPLSSMAEAQSFIECYKKSIAVKSDDLYVNAIFMVSTAKDNEFYVWRR